VISPFGRNDILYDPFHKNKKSAQNPRFREENPYYPCAIKTNISYKTNCPSPDGSDILFVFSLKIKRYSGQQEIAPNS
jgi:hypothetical protein